MVARFAISRWDTAALDAVIFEALYPEERSSLAHVIASLPQPMQASAFWSAVKQRLIDLQPRSKECLPASQRSVFLPVESGLLTGAPSFGTDTGSVSIKMGDWEYKMTITHAQDGPAGKCPADHPSL